jgi:hypothetical protein
VNLISPSGVARRFDVKIKTVESWRSRGQLPEPLPVEGGSRTPVWNWADLEKWGVDTGRLCRWRARRHHDPGMPYDPRTLDVDVVLPAHWDLPRVESAIEAEARGPIDGEALRPIGVERTTTELPASVRRIYGERQAQHGSAEGSRP